MHNPTGSKHGFTLIELAIVMVIIGLIVGGILTGRNLIDASAMRAQISQIEKYHTATNTFRGEYGYLPGDIKDPDASRFGFAARGLYAGEGDGNGILQGITADAPASALARSEGGGESVMVWADLSKAGMIEGAYVHSGLPTHLPAPAAPMACVFLLPRSATTVISSHGAAPIMAAIWVSTIILQ